MSSCGTMNPMSYPSMISWQPLTSHATVGNPVAAASITQLGRPSNLDDKAKMLPEAIAAAVSFVNSLRITLWVKLRC